MTLNKSRMLNYDFDNTMFGNILQRHILVIELFKSIGELSSIHEGIKIFVRN